MSSYRPRVGKRAVLYESSRGGHLSLLVVNPIGTWEYIGSFFSDIPTLTWYPHIVYEQEMRRRRPADLATQQWAWGLLTQARSRVLRGESLADMATHYITALPERPDFTMNLAPLDRPVEAPHDDQIQETGELCLF